MSGGNTILRRLMMRIRDRVMLTIGRGVLLAVTDKPMLQEIQAGFLRAEIRDGMERFQQYGFTSVPLPGAEVVAVFINGNRDHGLALSVDDRRHRPKGLNGGEVMWYSAFGQFIHFKADGSLVISAPNGVKIETPEGVEIEAKTIENHAAELFENSTNGYGQKWIYDPTADEWRTDSFNQNPAPPETGQVVAGGSFPVTPPEIS